MKIFGLTGDYDEPVGALYRNYIKYHTLKKDKNGDYMPSGQEKLDGGIKHDETKRRMDLVPQSLINSVAEVLSFGAKKYGDNNWRKGLIWSRCYAALQRHLNDFWAGEDMDAESKLCHLKHAACNIAFLIEFYEKRKDLDDRFIEQRKINE